MSRETQAFTIVKWRSIMQSPYTEKAKSVLQKAAKAARKSGQGYIGTEHILLGLYREENSVASRVLAENG